MSSRPGLTQQPEGVLGLARLLPDGEPQGVDFAQLLLVGQRRDVALEALERVVDALHPSPLAHVGGVTLTVAVAVVTFDVGVAPR